MHFWYEIRALLFKNQKTILNRGKTESIKNIMPYSKFQYLVLFPKRKFRKQIHTLQYKVMTQNYFHFQLK